MRGRLALALVVAAVPAGAASAATPDVRFAYAEGNVVTGGLRFSPADLTVKVGDQVVWNNTDVIAPHTVTERHGLWNLTGTYGATPINPAGFAPSTAMGRAFEAGTHRYYCVVHPMPMVGTVAVAPDIESRRVTRRIRIKKPRRDPAGRRLRFRIKTTAQVTTRWAVAAPASGQVFDVERRIGGGAWTPYATATTATTSTFSAQARQKIEVRARLRSATDANQATDWSPAAAITTQGPYRPQT